MQGQPSPTTAAAEGIQDIVFLGGPAPLLIRFHVQIDGKPFRAAWNDYLDHVFKHLDKDGDGILSPAEVERMPPASVLFGGGSNRLNVFYAELVVVQRSKAQEKKAVPERNYSRDEAIRHFFTSRGAVPFHIGGIRKTAG